MKIRQLATPVVFLGFCALSRAADPNPCPNAAPVPPALRLPAVMEPGEPVEFEKQVLGYLGTMGYRNLGWCVDVGVRDTGPFINSVSYGTHPTVRVYYSKEVSDWMLGGRKGAIADGAVIIKEQYKAPAAGHEALNDNNPMGCPNDWTFMIRNSKASRDGWFWGEVWYSSSPSGGMDFNDPFQYPNTGYGLYCVRCHASAANEFTFSSLSNIQGTAGLDGRWPLTFRVDNSWMVTDWQKLYTLPARCGGDSLPQATAAHGNNALLAHLRRGFVRSSALAGPPGIQTFPPEPWDKKLAGAGDAPRYVTSDQCTSCHSAANPASSAYGPNLFYPPDLNLSMYGEWRWSPMGLAGRDPVFFAQLQSEFAAQPAQKDEITNICLNCHGAMGLKSYYRDHGINPNKVPARSPYQFSAEWPFLKNPTNPNFGYGGLARDGISCAVCHRIAPPPNDDLAWFLTNYINGRYDETKPGTVAGPFKDTTQYPMGQALNLKPEESKFIKSSRMCGVCHTIDLPVLDSPTPRTSAEQVTYVEWLNSDFQNEYGQGSKAKACQDCHMPTSYENHAAGVSVKNVEGRLANVQDTTLPAAEHAAAPKDLTVRYRTEGVRRHEFLGLNGLLLEMFQQFADENGNNTVLGVRLADYMSGLTNDLPNAIANAVEQAKYQTAQVSVSAPALSNGALVADVEVTNLVGHRVPSGVGFRRMFLEVTVLQDGQPIFRSGGTNARGEIVDGAGAVLPTEYFQNKQYQPHFDVDHPIQNSNQVQIYEELTQNAKGEFTTSFLQRDRIVKDNRLLPVGWKYDGPPGVKIPEHFLEATRPVGRAAKDPVYTSGSGKSKVRYQVKVPGGVDLSHFSVTAKLWYQSTPPYFLADRAKTDSPATKRLQYLVNGLELDKTAFAGWKLRIGN